MSRPMMAAPETLRPDWPERRQWLIARRKELGLSQAALAAKVRERPSLISSWESGREPLRSGSLARWIEALGLTNAWPEPARKAWRRDCDGPAKISPPGATGPSAGVDPSPPKATSARVGRTKPKGVAPEAAPLAAAPSEWCAIHGCAHRAYTSHAYLCRGAPCECATLKVCLACTQERLRARYDAKPEGVVRG